MDRCGTPPADGRRAALRGEDLSPRRRRGWKVWVEPSGPNWRARWTGTHGTGQNSFLYKKDADLLASDKRQDFQRADASLPPLERLQAPKAALTVGQAADGYLAASKSEKAPRTYRNFDLPAITSLRAFLSDSKPLRDVRPADVQAWKVTLPDTTTASMHFRQAVAFFNHWVRMEELERSPARGIKKPPIKGGGRPLADDELTKLMAAAPELLQRAGTFSINTMTRIEEVCTFRWEWVTVLPSGRWLGRIPWQIRKGRRKIQEDCVFGINRRARAAMGDRQLQGAVFATRPTVLQHQITRVRRAAGLADDITFHCFRHTGASRYLENGGHLEDLLKSRIWADIRSLLRYVRVPPEVLARRFENLKTPPLGPYLAPKKKTAGSVSRARG